MTYVNFEDAFSAERLGKYVAACDGDTSYCLTIYARIMTLFQWMDIDSGSLLYGLDHVGTCSDKIMSI